MQLFSTTLINCWLFLISNHVATKQLENRCHLFNYYGAILQQTGMLYNGKNMLMLLVIYC